TLTCSLRLLKRERPRAGNRKGNSWYGKWEIAAIPATRVSSSAAGRQRWRRALRRALGAGVCGGGAPHEIDQQVRVTYCQQRFIETETPRRIFSICNQKNCLFLILAALYFMKALFERI